MSKLYFFTIDFPFGKQETFIETEIMYLSKEFDEIRIIPLYEQKATNNLRILPSNVKLNDGLLSKSYLVRLMNILFYYDHLIYKKFIKEYFDKNLYKSIKNQLFWFSNFVNVLNISKSKSFKKIIDIQDGVFYFYVGTATSLMLHFISKKKEC